VGGTPLSRVVRTCRSDVKTVNAPLLWAISDLRVESCRFVPCYCWSGLGGILAKEVNPLTLGSERRSLKSVLVVI